MRTSTAHPQYQASDVTHHSWRSRFRVASMSAMRACMTASVSCLVVPLGALLHAMSDAQGFLSLTSAAGPRRGDLVLAGAAGAGCARSLGQCLPCCGRAPLRAEGLSWAESCRAHEKQTCPCTLCRLTVSRYWHKGSDARVARVWGAGIFPGLRGGRSGQRVPRRMTSASDVTPGPVQ